MLLIQFIFNSFVYHTGLQSQNVIYIILMSWICKKTVRYEIWCRIETIQNIVVNNIMSK